MEKLRLQFKLIVICEFLYLFVAGEELKLALPLPFASSLLARNLQVGQLDLQIHDQITILIKFLAKPSPIVPRLLFCVLECLLDDLFAGVEVGELDHPVPLKSEQGLFKCVYLMHQSSLFLLDQVAVVLSLLLQLCDIFEGFCVGEDT